MNFDSLKSSVRSSLAAAWAPEPSNASAASSSHAPYTSPGALVMERTPSEQQSAVSTAYAAVSTAYAARPAAPQAPRPAAPAGKLAAVAVLRHRGEQEPVLLGLATDLSGYSIFQKSTAKQLMTFSARTLARKTAVNTRKHVETEGFVGYAHNRDGLVGVALTDKHYAQAAGFGTVGKVLSRFAEASQDRWRSTSEDSAVAEPAAMLTLKECADPRNADRMVRIQSELGEVKAVMAQSIDALLARGEKLESLLDKSSDLTAASKLFAKQARKANSCCRIM